MGGRIVSLRTKSLVGQVGAAEMLRVGAFRQEVCDAYATRALASPTVEAIDRLEPTSTTCSAGELFEADVPYYGPDKPTRLIAATEDPFEAEV